MMQPHEQRVVEELNQLTDKRSKLQTFICGGVFVGLPGAEQERLRRQYDIMGQYAEVLQERIENFPEHP